MAVKIRNSKTQEEKTVSQELWEKMRSTRKDWYAVGGADTTREVAQKPVAVRAVKPKAEPEVGAEATVLTEN